MPELPEVEALRVFLDDHLVGKEIARVLPLAISVLKTYDPPLTALEGTRSPRSPGTASSSTSRRAGSTCAPTSPGPAGSAGRTPSPPPHPVPAKARSPCAW